MEINHDEQKKWAHIPTNISIKEHATTPSSLDTGTLEQKWLKNDD